MSFLLKSQEHSRWKGKDKNMNDRWPSLLAVGDLILDEPDAETFFDLSAHVLRAGDVVVGQVEVPHTNRGIERSSDVPAPASDPRHLSALPYAGLNVATLAGNHVFDAGDPGVEDTLETLKSLGIATAGAGMNIAEARRPAIVERRGTRFGFLSYNCVGPKESWATRSKPGCAYVHVITHYELNYSSPGGPPVIYTFAEPDTLEAMASDIRQLRQLCDVLVVSLHKGLGHTPARLAMYEKQVSRAAIDAGADVVFGHHAHILQGMEFYKGKPIFHGLGNFVTVTRALSAENNPSPEREEWARRRRELFGFEPDPEYPTFPFHPDAKNTIIAKCMVDGGRIYSVSYIPCLINKKGQPEVVRNDERGRQVFDYVEKITRATGLNALFLWEGDEVAVREAK